MGFPDSGMKDHLPLLVLAAYLSTELLLLGIYKTVVSPYIDKQAKLHVVPPITTLDEWHFSLLASIVDCLFST